MPPEVAAGADRLPPCPVPVTELISPDSRVYCLERRQSHCPIALSRKRQTHPREEKRIKRGRGSESVRIPILATSEGPTDVPAIRRV